MLLCSARIPVAKKLTKEAFIALAIEWVNSSKYYSFTNLAWDGTPDYTCTGEKQEIFQVGLFDEQSICAVHFKNVDNRNISWTADFILDYENCILAFQLYRDAPEDIDYGQPRFSLPVLVKNIISAEYAAFDKDLKISNKPFCVCEEDTDRISKIILREVIYDMPIVYISCTSDGDYMVDPYKVAEKLNGVAHVVFEKTRSISFSLREKTNGCNPYAGAVEIFYPNGSRRFLPTQLLGTCSYKVYTIVNTVFEHLNQIRVEDKFLWTQLQSNKLRKQLSAALNKKEQNSKEYEIFENTYEEILSEKENQIKRLNDQLFSANNMISRLEEKLGACERISVLSMGKEQDLYPFEQQSLIIELLKKEYGAVADGSRRKHILSSLIEANKCENTICEKRDQLKACLRGYTKMTSVINKKLQEIGFVLSEDGKHIKLVFSGDSRYTGTLSKTGSDHRTGENITHDLIRSIF